MQAERPDDAGQEAQYAQADRDGHLHAGAARGGFGCPCHGGQYDTEGNRTAGPRCARSTAARTRSRTASSCSSAAVQRQRGQGTGADAKIGKYRLAGPGNHIDGIEQILYPFIRPADAKSDERKKAEAVVVYPLDWIEERSGLVGGVKYFLFRKVPGDTTGSTRSARPR